MRPHASFRDVLMTLEAHRIVRLGADFNQAPPMTIVASLSRRLYETLGNEAAGAMVDWMQGVEANRAELRALNDLSFSRIDSRFGEARAEIDLRFAEMRGDVDRRFRELRAEMDLRFGELRADLDRRFGEVNTRIDVATAQLNGRIDALRGEFGEKLESRYSDLLKWSFVFWATTMIALFLRTR